MIHSYLTAALPAPATPPGHAAAAPQPSAPKTRRPMPNTSPQFGTSPLPDRDRADSLRAALRSLRLTVGVALIALGVSAGHSVHAAELRLVPTFENCSVYVEGEDAAKLGPAAIAVSYRAAGAADAPWRPAHVLSVSSNDATPRGSLFGLRADTAYEVRAVGADGSVLASGSVRTWTENVPIARTVELAKVNPKGEPWMFDAGGTAEGWIRYVGSPGYVIEGGDSDSEAILFENASYIILENVTIRGGRRDGILVRNSHHIRILNCDISGYGRVAATMDAGKGYDAEGGLINWDSGIYVNRSSDTVIERCYIHDPRGNANPWTYGHPNGPNGIFVNSLGSLVIRYNDIAGSHAHRFNDVIEGYGNSKVDGGFNQDADIYGNLLAFSADDGTEMDGGQCNVRYYNNRIESMLCGISTAPNLRGPSYVFGNVVTNLGDARGQVNGGVKNGGGDSNSLGLTYFYHNTFFHKGRGIASVGFGKDMNKGMFRGITRNNVMATTSNGIEDRYTPDNADYNFDLFATPQGQPGSYSAQREMEADAIYAGAGFVDAAAGDFRLRPDSPALGSGTAIPGFTDTTALAGLGSAAPARGALQAGVQAAVPNRGLPIAADHSVLRLQTEGGAAGVAQTLTLRPTAALTAPVPFRIVKGNDCDWFEVEPMQGSVAPGASIALTVHMLPGHADAAASLLGLLRVVLDGGRSLPVTVYGQAIKVAFETVAQVESLPGAEAHETATELPGASGTALVFDKSHSEQPVTFTVNVPTDGDYYLYFRVLCPPPVPNHDSLWIAINGGELERCNIVGSAVWSWTSYTGTRPVVTLTKGANTLALSPRETLYLDAVTVRTTPLPIYLDPTREAN